MAKPAAGEFWFLDDPHWQGWLDGFPSYTLLTGRDFSTWRRGIEAAARQPFPEVPLSKRDKAVILAALTSHADRLTAKSTTTSTTTAILTSISAATAVGALLFPPLLPVTAGMLVLTSVQAARDIGLGSNAGNAAVNKLLIETANKLPVTRD